MDRFVMHAVIAAVGMAFGAAHAASTLMSKGHYNASKEVIEADYVSAKGRCASLAANAKDVCMAEAKGRERIASAELEAGQKPSQKSRADVRLAKAQAAYDVSRQKCDDLAGNPRDVCLKEAKAVHATAKADLKASKQIAEAGKEAATSRRNADYAVAKEKCEARKGDTKEGCINAARSQYKQP